MHRYQTTSRSSYRRVSQTCTAHHTVHPRSILGLHNGLASNRSREKLIKHGNKMGGPYESRVEFMPCMQVRYDGLSVSASRERQWNVTVQRGRIWLIRSRQGHRNHRLCFKHACVWSLRKEAAFPSWCLGRLALRASMQCKFANANAKMQCNLQLQLQFRRCTVISTSFSLSKGSPMNVLKTALVGEKQSKCIAQKVNCAMSNLAMPRSSTEDGNPNHFSKGLLRFGHRLLVRPTLSLPP